MTELEVLRQRIRALADARIVAMRRAYEERDRAGDPLAGIEPFDPRWSLDVILGAAEERRRCREGLWPFIEQARRGSGEWRRIMGFSLWNERREISLASFFLVPLVRSAVEFSGWMPEGVLNDGIAACHQFFESLVLDSVAYHRKFSFMPREIEELEPWLEQMQAAAAALRVDAERTD